MRKALIFTLIVACALGILSPRSAVSARLLDARQEGKIDQRVQDQLAKLPADEMITVIVTLKHQADLKSVPASDRITQQQSVIRALQANALTSQGSMRAALATQRVKGGVSQVTSFWIFNGMSVTASPDVIYELAVDPEVVSITPNEIDIVPSAPLAYLPAETNLALINPRLVSAGR